MMRLKKKKMGWSAACWEYRCSDGVHDSFWKTVVASPQWREWEAVAEQHGYDVTESRECGWISSKHFQAFLDFAKEAQ